MHTRARSSTNRATLTEEGLGMTPGIIAITWRCSLPIYGPVEMTMELKSGSPTKRSKTEPVVIWGWKHVEGPGGVSSDSRGASISVWNNALPEVLVRWRGRSGS
ncbi:hypothetical protein GWK47_035778 [Chionoecetes opilio]|uniref:Uncharacterized protein n=1 Tax=Chionoecetes opilio TaxID=41210 RepID=A0A8J4YEX6_CHIOP|nr:hypothetical protein GWK47_035778 [Chionoecetes opilio]